MAKALEADLATCITPLVAGLGQRNELLDLSIDGQRIDSASFALPLAAACWHGPAASLAPETAGPVVVEGRLDQAGDSTLRPAQGGPDTAQTAVFHADLVLAWPLPAQGDALHRELTRRQAQSSQLMGNFMAQLAQAEHHDNWRSLYRLAPAQIDILRQTPLTAGHAEWLAALPKADLYRHLGGCLDLTAQREVARCIWSCAAARKHGPAGGFEYRQPGHQPHHAGGRIFGRCPHDRRGFKPVGVPGSDAPGFCSRLFAHRLPRGAAEKGRCAGVCAGVKKFPSLLKCHFLHLKEIL